MPPDQGGRVVGRIIGASAANVEVAPVTQLPEVESPFVQPSDAAGRNLSQESREGVEPEEPAVRQLIQAASSHDTFAVIAAWRTFLEAQYAQATVKMYMDAVVMLFATHPVPVTHITEDHVVLYLQRWQNRPPIRRARFQGLKSFFGWCHRRQILDHDPTLGLKIPHPTQKVPRGLTREEIQRVFAAAYDRAPQRGATLEVLYYTACRVGEAVTIRWDDIDEERVVLHGWKSKKERIVDMTPPLRKALETLWEWSGTFDYVVPRSKATVWGWCRQAGRDSGVDRVHPHLFRSTSATIMNEAGASAFAIQTALGHAKVQTTMRYVALRDVDRRAAFESLALPG